MTHIHLRIRHLRVLNNYPQKQVAAYLGISQPAYSKIESGKTKITAQHILKLSELFSCRPDALLKE
jgi:transcriptional regulator with XRE-family HTH domain